MFLTETFLVFFAPLSYHMGVGTGTDGRAIVHPLFDQNFS